MKRWLCLAAALMLTPVLASAQMVSISELYDQARTLGRWKASYEAHGRTIDVDIPIIVPEVEYCPVLTVNAVQPFSDEQMEEIKDRFSFQKQEGRYVIQGEEAGFEERAGDIVKLSFTPKAGSSDFIKERARVSVSCNDHLRKINEEMLMMGKAKPGAYYWGWEMEQDTAYAEDNPMTTGQAIEVVDRVLDRVYPEIEVRSVVNAAIVNNRLRERKTENVLMESPIGSYSFQLLQTIYGVPIGMGASNLLSLKDGSYISTGMNATVLSDYVYSVMTMHPAGIREVVYPDVPLASLDEVICEVEKEIKAGHIREVYALELTYGLHHDKKDKSLAWLYPTWVLSCLYAEKPDEELKENLYPDYENDYFYNRFEYEVLPVYAQVPELKSPQWRLMEEEKDKLNRYIVPRILTWQEIDQ